MKDGFDVEYLRKYIDGATGRIAQVVQHEMRAVNSMGFNLDVFVNSIDVKTLGSNLPKQLAEVKLNVSL